MSSGNSRYSVVSLFREYDEIKIPIIQRDYAQGRESAKEIRKNFLNSIKDNLDGGIHLDFIYGSVEENKDRKILILLDGQQRITTLFLLYWYSAVKDGKIEEFREKFCIKNGKNHKSKLRYEVRASSEEFLDYIVTDNDIKFEDNNKPSEIIKDKNWFYLGWLQDPTISGMLNMIDDINKTFGDIRDLFNILYNDPQRITFDFLELNNFGLTDDLYIKMNSRGKLLTSYENFKAKFEKIIEKRYRKEKFIEIAKKFEKDYLDIFWNYAKQNMKGEKHDIARLTDEYMYWFFYNLTLNLYALNNETDLRGNYNILDNFVKENFLISFYKNVYASEKEIDFLIGFLEHLCSNNQNIPEQVKDILKENPTLWSRIKFYAYYIGIIEHKDDEHWYRVLKNLINNTRIDSLDDYLNALKAIKKLNDDLNGQKILDYIKDKENFVGFFNQNQQKEEILKAKLINEDWRWEKEIIKAENHWYLDGKIGFLIEFSKNGGSYDLKAFKEYRDKFIKLWDFVKNNKDNQILLYRALLSKGDYLPKMGSNKTFCSFETGIRAKSENWHKVFESDKKEYLKSLLYDINSTNNIEDELNNIIKKSTVTDWRKYFIENPDYIKYCENLQLYFFWNHNIYILTKKRTNGYHVELHSWHFFNKCFGISWKDKGTFGGEKACKPFKSTTYYEATSLYCEPYILLNNYEQDIKLKIEYKWGKLHINLIDQHKQETYDQHKQETYIGDIMIEEYENCCEWLIKQISEKVREALKNPRYQKNPWVREKLSVFYSWLTQ